MNERSSENLDANQNYPLLESRIPHFRFLFPSVWKIASRFPEFGKRLQRAIVKLFLLLLLGNQVLADSAVPLQPRRTFGLGDVESTAVSPDFRFLASAGHGGIFIWDMATGNLLHRLQGIRSATTLAFSPDSKMLFAGDATIVRSWNPENAEHIRDFVGHTRGINRLTFSPGGTELISASSDNSVRIWSIITGEVLRSIRIPGSSINDAAVSPDGERVVTIDTFLTNSVKLWSKASGIQIGFLPKTNWIAQRCIFSRVGLVSASTDGTISLWSERTLQLVRHFKDTPDDGQGILDLWLPDESTVAALYADGKAYFWNAENGERKGIIAGDVGLNQRGIPGSFASITTDFAHRILVRDLQIGGITHKFEGHTTSTHSGVAFSPDGRFVLSGGTEVLTRLWNRETGELVRTFSGSAGGTATVGFSSDGSKVITTIGFPHRAARLWKTESGELEREFIWTGGWPTGVALSSDDSRIAVAAQDGWVRVYDTTTGTLTRTMAKAGGPTRLALAPNAPLLICGATDYTASLYNFENGQKLHDFFANAGPVTSVAFSPDGDAVLIGWQDGLIQVFGVSSLELRREFHVQSAFLDAAAFSPDGQFILTGQSFPSFTTTLWDSKTAQPLRTFYHNWIAGAVAFSPDGASILTGADIVREWSTGDLASRLRIESLPNQIRLNWSYGKLERALNIQGPWEPVLNANSPFTTSSKTPAAFYRVHAD